MLYAWFLDLQYGATIGIRTRDLILRLNLYL